MREINQAVLDLIKSFEGILDGNPATSNLDPYLDPVGIWTIGWGHAIVVGKDFLRGKQNRAKAFALYPCGLTIPEAETLLRADVMDKCRDVDSLIKVSLNDNQYAAIVSFTFNLGVGNLKQSTLLKKLNAGDFEGAANEFRKWNKAGGRVLAGLTRRREAEAALFRRPVT